MNAKTALLLAIVGVVLFFEAEAKPKSAVCTLPLVTGPCRASIGSYGFDVKSQQCIYFTYGGCDGNDNRFSTLKQCQAACRPRRFNC